jgi:hypothetical protein
MAATSERRAAMGFIDLVVNVIVMIVQQDTDLGG